MGVLERLINDNNGGGGGGGAVDSVFGRTGDVVAVSGDYTAAQITNTPAGGIAATTAQAAINELDTEKAPLASPTFTGVPAAPTATAGTNTTQLATTAFVSAAASSLFADGFYDAILDGVGTAPNHYVNVKAAHDAGKSRMKVTTDITDNTSFTYARSLFIYVVDGASVHFNSDMQMTIGAYSIEILQSDTPAIATIKYTQSGSNKPLFIGGFTSSVVSLIGCGIDMTDVTGAGSSICETSILRIDGSVVYAGNADSAGFSPAEFGSSAAGAIVIGSGANSENIYVNKGCYISNISVRKGASSAVNLFKHSSPLAITEGINIDNDISTLSAEIIGTLKDVTISGGDLSIVNAGDNVTYTNIPLGSSSLFSSLGNCSNVFLNDVRTDGSFINDPTDSNYLYTNCKFNGVFLDVAANSKLSTCSFEGTSGFSGATPKILGCSFENLVMNGANSQITNSSASASFTGSGVSSSTRAGNNSIIGNNYDPITGTHSTLWQGPYTTPTSGNIPYSLLNGEVTLQFPAVSAAATIGSQTITNTVVLPSNLRPSANQIFTVLIVDSAIQGIGTVQINTSGTITFRPNTGSTNTFTNLGSPGFLATTIKYKI